MAAEYAFEEKDDQNGKNSDDEERKTLARHGAFFLWIIAMAMSFMALKGGKFICYGLGSTLLLWLLVNINRPKFDPINEAAKRNLNPEYNPNETSPDSEFKGAGL